MLTITEKIPAFDTYEDYLGYRSESALFFDIETTGLSAATSIVFLIGVMKKCDDGWQLTQWLAQHPEEEALLLQAFSDATAGCDTLIHFNGTTFDLPFIKKRMRRLGCTANLKSSLDLYQKFRPLKQVLGLARMNQTTLEQFLDWPREDRLSGKQMVSLFQKYVASQEPLLCDLLLLHNHDDLLGMTGLLRLCTYSMLFEGQFITVNASMPGDSPDRARSANTGDKASTKEAANITGSSHNCLKLRLTLKASLPQNITLSVPCAFPGMVYTLTASGTQAILSIPGICGELRHFFPNWRDYYYLPLEDQVIHKSVGAFVDKEYRVPATPANCCIKKSGLFFPQPEECFSPAFKVSHNSRELFFTCPEHEASAQPAHESEPCPTPGAESYPQQEMALSLDHERLVAYTASLLRMFTRHA